MDAKNLKTETENPAPTSEFNQPAGWFAFWAFLMPLLVVVGLAISGLLR